MEKVKLGDVSKLINGDRGKNYPSQADITEEGEIPFVNAGHLNGREIDFSEMNYISQDKYDNLRSGKFQEGDILYCLRGSLGKKAIVSNDVNGAIASSLVIIRPDKEKVDGEYLMFALDSPAIKEQLVKANNGSSQPNLSASSVREYQVELPNISVQKEVVEKLIKVRNIIDCRRKELQLLDSLIKARFVEMFGDVIHNSKKWQVCLFAEITSSRLGKMLDAKQQTGRNSYPYLANFNVQWFRFNLENLNKMDFDEKDRAEFELREGDLLVCEGGEIGRCAVWHNELQPCFFQKALHRVRCNHQIILPDYLAWWFRYNCDYGGFSALAGAKATIAHLPGAKLKQLQVAVPPMELQEQFAVFVAQTDKSKVAVQKALDEAQLLFDSLMQEYFG